MRCLTIITILFLLQSQANAQLKGFSFGGYLEAARPVSEFGNTHNNGLGAGVTADVRLGQWGLTGSAGYMRFGGKAVSLQDGAYKAEAISAIPIRAGIKFRPLPLLYVKMETGTARISGDEGEALILSPGVGLRFLGLDVQFKYESWRGEVNRNFWGLRAGYNF